MNSLLSHAEVFILNVSLTIMEAGASVNSLLSHVAMVILNMSSP